MFYIETFTTAFKTISCLSIICYHNVKKSGKQIMVHEDQLGDLSLKITKGGSCFLRLMILSSIPFLLFLFALLGYFKIVNFHVEIHSVLMIGIIFLIFIGFMKNNAYYASCQLKEKFVKIKHDLLHYINKNLLEIAGIEKANAPFEEFIQEVSKSLRNENFSSIAAGVFPTLGILGTFISIAISMPDFSAHTSAVLEQEISKLLGGVGTAFYVSIYGIFLSLWWLFFEKNGVSKFQKDVLIIKEAVHEYFWQKEEIEQTYFRKSMENFEKLNSLFDTFSSHEFVNNVNETLQQRMHVFEQIIQHEQDASNKVVDILENAGAHLEVILNKESELAATLQKHSINFAQAHNSLSDEFTNAVHIAEVLSQTTQKLSETLANINTQNVQNLYTGVIENIESMKNEIDAIGQGLDEKINKFDEKFIEKLKNTLSLIDSETAAIISQIERLHVNEKK
jgi:hypothetical protein